MSKINVITSLVGLSVGAMLGSTVTYFAVRSKFKAQADDEIRSVSESIARQYSLIRKEDGTVSTYKEVKEQELKSSENEGSTDSAVGVVEELVNQYSGLSTEDTESTINIFAVEDEIEEPDPDNPYRISEGEFMEEGPQEKTSLIYYEKDDTLADESYGVLAHDLEGLIGLRHLNQFGKQSNDKNAVYIRNEELGVDFEIMRSQDSYVNAMYGIDPDKDGDYEDGGDRKVKRMRADD